MAVPEFVAELRRSIGSARLWLPGVTAVVVRDDHRVLLCRRSDNGAWTPVTGIVEPDEQPAAAAVREVREETRVTAVVERLAWVHTEPETVHVNGDRAQYLDLTFACRYVSGDARVGDDESTEVGWYALDHPPVMEQRFLDRIDCAVHGAATTRFDAT